MATLPCDTTISFLTNIDPDLVQHEPFLVEMGFTSTRSLKFLRSSDLISIPKAHSRFIMASVDKLLTPTKCLPTIPKQSSQLFQPKELFGIDFATPKDFSDESQLDEYTCYKYESPIEKEIGEQELKLDLKHSEIQTVQNKISDLENMYSSSSADDVTVGIICSHCHVRGSHTSAKCIAEKCVTR
jgi:hypothetical protein